MMRHVSSLRPRTPICFSPSPVLLESVRRSSPQRHYALRTPLLKRTPLKSSSPSLRWQEPLKRGDLHVCSAIFGVGAPEAVLVVVVALVVFGPKGLAEGAKGLGQLIRSFAPTLRELAEVSTDLKSTLQQEIGLEEITQDLKDAVNPTLPPISPSTAPTATQGAMDEDIEAKRAESAKLAWGVDSVPEETPESTILGADTSETVVQPKPVGLSGMSTEELEAELERRKQESEPTI